MASATSRKLTKNDMKKMYDVMRSIVGDSQTVYEINAATSQLLDVIMFIDAIAVKIKIGQRTDVFEKAKLQYADDAKISVILSLITDWIENNRSPYQFLPGSEQPVVPNLIEWSRLIV